MTAFDPDAYKTATQQQWDAVADRWNAWAPQIDRWLGPVTETLYDMAAIGPGARVLHVAGGSGQEALQSARRVGPAGRVVTTDFSERLTALAAANLAGFDNAEARLMDGEVIAVDEAPFDAVISRVGLIFFPDQEGSVRQQAAALRPGGAVGAIVYATAEECRFFSEPIAIIRRHAALPPPLPGQPGPFSLGAPGAIEDLFARAGLVDVESRKVPTPVIMASAAECLRFMQESFGALHQMLAKLDTAARESAWAEVGRALEGFEAGGRFEGPCTMIAAIARKP